MEKLLADTEFDVWKKAFTLNNFSRLPKAVPGVLVHIKQREDNPQRCTVEFATDQVRHLVIYKYFRQNRQELISFLNANTPERMVSARRAELVEECMHQEFSNAVSLMGLHLRKLVPKSTEVPLNLPVLVHRFFRFLNMSDFTQIQLNDYYQPLICNFPAVDAISLMERKVFDGPQATGLVGVGFQATASKMKPKGVLRDDLSRVREKLRVLTNNATLPLYLVFVSTVDGLNSRQSVGSPAEPGDDEYVQFVIRGISFEAMTTVIGDPEDRARNPAAEVEDVVE